MSAGEWQMLLLGFVLGWLVPVWLQGFWRDRFDELMTHEPRFPPEGSKPPGIGSLYRKPERPKKPTGEPPDFSSLFNPNPPCDCERSKR